jgi:hypothetical protein
MERTITFGKYEGQKIGDLAVDRLLSMTHSLRKFDRHETK